MKFSFLLVTLLFSFFTSAQNLEKKLLWEITGNGLEKPSYIFGTMPFVCETNVNEKVLETVERTEQLYLEININGDEIFEITDVFKMKNNVTITSLLKDEDTKIVDNFLIEQCNTNLDAVNEFTPIMVTTLFAKLYIECPIKSIDQEIAFKFIAQNKEIKGLESRTYLLKALEQIPYNAQAKQLVTSIKQNLEIEKTEFQKLLIYYANEDIQSIYETMKNSHNEISKKYFDVFYTNRNKNWIPEIEKAIKDKTSFFSIGAMHLAGEDGVINLLRKKGYNVKAHK